MRQAVNAGLLFLAACVMGACAGPQRGAGSQTSQGAGAQGSAKAGSTAGEQAATAQGTGDTQPATAKPADGPRPWGDPVPDPRAEAFAMQALAAISDGQAIADTLLGEPLVLGPALWAVLREIDPELGNLGIMSQAVIPMGEKMQTLEMRTFLDKDSQRALLGREKFRAVAETFRQGKARPATEQERHLFYIFIPFEIEGRPLTVVDMDKYTLVVLVQEGRITWLDLLSEYQLGSVPETGTK